MITYDIDVLIGQDNPNKGLAVKCHDTGVCLRVSFKQGYVLSKYRTEEKPYSIPSGSTVVLKIAKPDGTYVLQTGEAHGLYAAFSCHPQSFTALGKAEAEVNIFDTDGRRITSATFYIDVLKEAADDCAEESADYVDVLAEQIKQADAAADRADEAARQADEAAIQAEKSAGKAEDNAKKTIAAAEQANKAASQADAAAEATARMAEKAVANTEQALADAKKSGEFDGQKGDKGDTGVADIVGYTGENLAVNTVYTAELSGETAFVLPVPTDLMHENRIRMLASVATDTVIDWGTTVYYGAAVPFITSGFYEFLWDYNPLIGAWVAGATRIGQVVSE